MLVSLGTGMLFPWAGHQLGLLRAIGALLLSATPTSPRVCLWLGSSLPCRVCVLAWPSMLPVPWLLELLWPRLFHSLAVALTLEKMSVISRSMPNALWDRAGVSAIGSMQGWPQVTVVLCCRPK